MAAQTQPGLTLPLLSAALCGVGVLYFRRERPYLLALAFVFALGMARLEAAHPSADAEHISRLNNLGQLTVEGWVIREPEALDSRQRVLVATDRAGGHAVQGRLLAYIPRNSTVAYGDRVQLFGRLTTPPQFDTFSYRDHLAQQAIFSVMPTADVQVLAQGGGRPFTRAILRLKEDARSTIQSALPEPHASLLVGILLGDETGLPQSTREAFNRTGTAHIIAISGFNMAILAQFIHLGVGRLFPRRRWGVTWSSIALIALYTVLVGAGAAVVRAALMSSLLLVGQTVRRKSYVPASLSAAALLMSIADPWVWWDVGFQLSLAAVLGMALFVEPFKRGLFGDLVQRTTHPLGRPGAGHPSGCHSRHCRRTGCHNTAHPVVLRAFCLGFAAGQ
ncbi:MAG: ComEC/Rec2 family competence protein [Anaerolineae bacterium]|nr:ComEC/Rec2 family competence protein [Anaerolineae bacterium]